MKRALALVAATLTLSVGAHAWAQTAPASPAQLALAQRVIQASGVGESSKEMLASLGRSIPPVGDTAADQAKARARVDATLAAQSDMIPRLMNAITEAYAENFTPAELNGLLAFYESPTGRALVAKTPVVGRSVAIAAMRLVPDMIQDIERRYCAQVTCTAEERQKTDETVAKLRARLENPGGPRAH